MNVEAIAISSGALLVAASLCGGCHDQRDYQVTNGYAQVMDADQDPGAHVVATNDLSSQVLDMDPAPRRAWFQTAIVEAGHECRFVTSAVIKAGLDDKDLWRVGCLDGAWLVTIGPGEERSFQSCSGVHSSYCIDGLKSLEWPQPDS